MLLIGLVGLAGIWGSYIRVGEIMRGLKRQQYNDWRRNETHEKMLKDIAEIRMEGSSAVGQLRLIKGDMDDLRSDVRATWSLRSLRRGSLGS
jgi:hypothetical protein